MKKLSLLFLLFFTYLVSFGQDVIIEEGAGVGPLRLGMSYEAVMGILGFEGELKTYDDYLAEELFNDDPEIALECAIGFDYYVKYEHLLTLPVSYVFFKDNVITQIKVSSFPEYYYAIAKETKTGSGLTFWAATENVLDVYGTPDLKVNYDSFILDSYFYFQNGITLNLRENNYRSAHIYAGLAPDMAEKFSGEF
jgi:hypothetical protein